MSNAETRALMRAAGLILLASTLRWGWGTLHPSPRLQGPDQLPTLLEESQERTADAQARARPLAPGERLDPNRATATELDRLPGVGPATAAAIVAFRRVHDPFRAAADLARVQGVGESTVARISDHLDFSSAPPRPVVSRSPPTPSAPRAVTRPPTGGGGSGKVDLNRADVEALQALPGIGPALARRIVEARAKSPFHTVDELTRVSGIGPATLARLRPRVTVGR